METNYKGENFLKNSLRPNKILQEFPNFSGTKNP